MINTAIMGCGTIGSGVYETIVQNQEIIRKEICDSIRVKKILDLRTFPGEPFADLVTADFSEIENDPEIVTIPIDEAKPLHLRILWSRGIRHNSAFHSFIDYARKLLPYSAHPHEEENEA